MNKQFSAIIISVIILAIALPVACARDLQVFAVPCDHRYGAEASWSHNTDTAQNDSFFYAEACGFKYNLALTVFDNPIFQKGQHVPLAERRAAAATGRVSFQVYFSSDRWCDPHAAKHESNPDIKFPVIPDYYAATWTDAAVAAGFNVQPGQSKPTRFPNHGQQLYDISNGQYGFNVNLNQPGKTDVLTPLVLYQKQWIQSTIGQTPSTGAYRNGQTGAAYALAKFFLGMRGSDAAGVTSYGKSTEQEGFLGTPAAGVLTPEQLSNRIYTLRADQMDLSTPDMLHYAAEALRQTIAQRGWYNDFIHWHNTKRPAGYLHDYFQTQRTAMTGHDIVTVDFGDALEHKTLRDMATVATTFDSNALILQVTYRDPYGDLPLETMDIPLSVKIDLSDTPLSNCDIAAEGAQGIRKMRENVFIIEVPFHQKLQTISVKITPTQTPAYLDFSMPRVIATKWTNDILNVETQPATKLALFSNFDEKAAKNVRCLSRGNTLNTHHGIDLSKHRDALRKKPLHIGVITQQGQSILYGPLELK